MHGGDGGHLAAHDGLDRPAFRGVRVGHVAAQNGVPRAYHAVEPEHVRARAERDEEHVDVIAEQRLEAALGFGGPRVVAVRFRRAHVGLVQGLHHFRVHATGIVAGKSAIHLAASFRQMSFGKAWRSWGGETCWRMGKHPPYFSSPLTPFPSKTFVFIESLSAAFPKAGCLENGTSPKKGSRMNTADGTLPCRQPTSVRENPCPGGS